VKALVYPAWDTLEVRDDVPEPVPARGEVVLEVAAVGICGSEVEAVASRSPRRTPPLVMGHEFCGVVAAVGADVAGVREGDRVAASSLVPCGRCRDCRAGRTNVCPDRQIFGMNRPGAFAERVAVPARVLLPLPERVSPLEGALVEPLGNAVHVWRLVRPRFPETVVVLGAGTIGLMALQVARAGGALTLIAVDTNAGRLETAHGLGAEPVFDPGREDVVAAVADVTRGRGADVVIDAVGAPATRRAAVELVRPGGDVVWIGTHGDVTELSGRAVVLGERRISGSYDVTDEDLETAIGLFAHRRVEIAPWARPFPLEEGAAVFRALLTAPPRDYAKALLLP
jgi:threonine dehydrogenase-like Zn-dependent dehydrogenase